MDKTTVIPFGPQHPVLPEPIHVDLELQDEKVVRAIPSIGYIHRGLEKLVETRGFQEYAFVAERVCGICSFGHGWGYCKAVEGLMGIEIPERAQYLRILWHELSRIHSHLLWLGLAADGLGFESMFMHAWRLRETVLDIFEQTTGGRVIFSVCEVGGVRRDIKGDMLKEIVTRLQTLKKEIQDTEFIFLGDETVHSRLKGVGKLSAEDVVNLGCVGPLARASGVPLDYRCGEEGGSYKKLGFRPITATAGDCFARCQVRFGELLQSIDIIQGCVENMAEGPVTIPVKGFPPAEEYFTRVEQPRGEAFYYVKGNKTKNLERFRLRTPTNVNIPALVKMLQGCDLADVPNIILTLDPCISCCER